MSHPTTPPEEGLAQDEAMVTLEIDGTEVSVPEGTLLIRAAERLGIMIPRFCDHPLLDPAGACRQCIVEVEDQPKPMTSCTAVCQEGMVVRTHLTSQLAREAQEAQLEFLLINHPLDCPMCDKGGECPLQDQALSHGPGESRFIDSKRRYEKPVAVNPNVLLDRERCVLCARCTRFAQQISGRPFIELFERGALQQVAIFEDEPYADYFSGNIIQICPVGALTSATYRFRARPFDLESRPSVCGHCSAGCNLHVQSRRGSVMRQLARTNMEVNEAWSCDKGRFAFTYLTHPTRLFEPKLRLDGALVSGSWSDALDRAAAALRDADRVAVLTGGRIPDEDAHVLARYADETLDTGHVDFRVSGSSAEEDRALVELEALRSASYADVEGAPVVLVVGLDPEEEVPILFLRLRKAWLKRDARLVAIGPRAGRISELLWRRLATAPGGEGAALDSIVAALDGEPDSHGPGDASEDVAAALRDALGRCVVLVGERATAALPAARRLAERIGGLAAWVPRRNNSRGALDAGLLPREPGHGLHAILEEAASGRIDVLHLVGVDLLADCDRPALAAAALERTPFVIAQDLLETETVARADVVLPAAAPQERAGSFTNWEGRRQPFRPAIAQPRLVLEDWQILTALAARLGSPLPYTTLTDIREEMGEAATRRDPGASAAPAAPTTMERGGSDDAGGGLTLVTYPLLLDKGAMGAGADEMLQTAQAPFVALNVADAERLGIEHGDEVTVATDHAELRLSAVVEDDVAAGCVFVPSNSTEPRAHALAGDVTGPVRVRVGATASGRGIEGAP